jgi:alkyldihydroxyacetonephosphate synthase
MSPWLKRALEIVKSQDGVFELPESQSKNSHRSGSSGNWRNSFIKAPYLRESFVRRGIVQDTFETAITWDKSYEFIEEVKKQTSAAIKEISGKPALVACRLTHCYPDGLAPYFTYGAYATPHTMIDVWREIKLATNEICVSLGGTVTHHHAVGRDHRPNGYDIQIPGGFKDMLTSAKERVDPLGIMNPGTLIDPTGIEIQNWITKK